MRHLRLAWVAGAIALVVAGAGCSSASSTPSSSNVVKGGTASYGFVSGSQPNWIFPYDSPAYSSVSNLDDLQQPIYRPLYWFGGQNDQPTADYGLSVANAPVYSDGGKTVVINMKGWKWSDGETVDAQDVIFWLHMMEAEPDNYYGFVPSDIPQDITSMAATGANQVTLHLNQAYSSLWYTYNELSQITPMPAAWDVTSIGASPGSGGCVTDSAADGWAKCKAVYNFLTAQAQKAATYPSSPIWSVVDGPWRLKSFNPNGSDSLVPNPKYSGSPKPQLAQVELPDVHQPFGPVHGDADRRGRRRPGARQRPAGQAGQRVADQPAAGLRAAAQLHVQLLLLPDQLQLSVRRRIQPALRPAGARVPGGPGRHGQGDLPRLRLPDHRPGADRAREPVGSLR